MNLLVEHVVDEVRGAWRFRWWALAVAWFVAVLGWSLVMLLPDIYEARATIFVDTRTALRPVLQGLAVEQDVDAELNFVRQSLLGTPQLERIARDVGLLSAQPMDVRERLKVIDGLRDRIVITVTSASSREADRDAGSIYGIVYQDRDRERSLKVVSALLNTLVVDTLGGKRQGSQDAQKFLETQIKDYEARLRTAEDRLADFKKQNVGAMPTEQGGYFARLQTEMDAVKTAETALSVAVSRRDELSRQLHGESAVTSVPAAGGPGLKSGGDTLERIHETQARLDELLLNYTDKHPDVIAARETLAELNARRQAEIESLRRGDANAVANSGAASNPVYQSIQVALNQADVEIATLRRQLSDHQSRVIELRRALDTMPKVEAEYAQLNRDYDVNKTQYTALLTQLEKAKLGQEADTNGSVRFEVVEPPNAEYRPVAPRRALLVLAVLAMALGIGAGLAYLVQMLKPVFWSVRTLSRLLGGDRVRRGERGVPANPAASQAMGHCTLRTSDREPFGSGVRGVGLHYAWPAFDTSARSCELVMSLVEKSIAKVRAAVPGTAHASDPRLQPVGSVEVAAEAALLGLPGAVSRFVRIDRKRLRAAGFLPDESVERRFADQYRRIKRPILHQVQALSAAHAPGARLILMASALPGDGKTFSSINLALSMARERDISILMIDADVAKPHISRIFGVDQEPGLLDALANDSLDVESLVLPTDVQGLSMLAAGKQNDAATELLASARMDQVITRLTAHDPRRIVLLDSPPLLLSSESRALVQIAGQVVLVVCAGRTPRRAVEEAVASIGEDKPLGLVLNQSELALSEGYYGYGSYGDDTPPAGAAGHG